MFSINYRHYLHNLICIIKHLTFNTSILSPMFSVCVMWSQYITQLTSKSWQTSEHIAP